MSTLLRDRPVSARGNPHRVLHDLQFRTVRFRHEPEDDDEHAKDADIKGADTVESFGYSAIDPADYLYERWGKSRTETRPKREVF